MTTFNASIVSEHRTAYEFEVYDVESTRRLLHKYEYLMYGTVLFYLIAVFVGRKIMGNRPAFQLNRLLFWWNIFNSAFATVATIRALPEFVHILSKSGGFLNLVCSMEHHNYVMSFWWLMWVLSKFVELGDTFFIVLRKSPLSTVHWWHHSTTLICAWLGFQYVDPVWGRAFVLNTFVHSLMYFYYALKAIKVKVPRRISMYITTIQLAQMATFATFHASSLISMVLGRECHRPLWFFLVQIIFEGGFFYLLVQFFIQAYFSSNTVLAALIYDRIRTYVQNALYMKRRSRPLDKQRKYQ